MVPNLTHAVKGRFVWPCPTDEGFHVFRAVCKIDTWDGHAEHGVALGDASLGIICHHMHWPRNRHHLTAAVLAVGPVLRFVIQVTVVGLLLRHLVAEVGSARHHHGCLNLGPGHAKVFAASIMTILHHRCTRNAQSTWLHCTEVTTDAAQKLPHG